MVPEEKRLSSALLVAAAAVESELRWAPPPWSRRMRRKAAVERTGGTRICLCLTPTENGPVPVARVLGCDAGRPW